MNLKTTFLQLVNTLTGADTATAYWHEIEKHYTAKGRHYHTLAHLDNMFTQLLPYKSSITQWDTLIFSLVYHDIVYSATAKDNEEKSAVIAAERLKAINFPEEKIAFCQAQIIATKQHLFSESNDTNLFIDADLSILGAPWPAYESYCKNVRKEYCIYPDFLYKPGRKKAMAHFLEMEYIFKTAGFRDAFEASARHNIAAEIKSLTTP